MNFLSRDGKRLSLLAYLLLVALCMFFFLPGIVTLPPTDRDESSFAQASKQMIETGNYVDIRLQKEPRYKKPIGIYWMQSASVKLLNPDKLNEIWAYRIPSLIGAAVAVISTAAIGALLFSPATGFVAAVMLASSILLNVEARLAKTDAALLGCTLLAMYGLAKAWMDARSVDAVNTSGGAYAAAIFWTALACGVLIKGPMILLPIVGTVIWLRIYEGNVEWLRALHPVKGLVYLAAVVAPWIIAISMQSQGGFLQQSAGHDMLAKIFQGQNRGFIPPGAHALLFPFLFFPFSVFSLLAIPFVYKNRRAFSVMFCLGWIVPAWLVFELSSTKLPHYVLSAYPAIALLTAHFFLTGWEENASRYAKLIKNLWMIAGAVIAGLFAALPFISDEKISVLQIAVGIAVISLMLVAIRNIRKDRYRSFFCMVLASFIFISVTIGHTLPDLHRVWLSREIVREVRAIEACDDLRLVTLGYREPSLAFLAGTNTVMAKNLPDALSAIGEGGCLVVAIGAKHKQAFDAAVGAANMGFVEAGHVYGVNSGHGSREEMVLYKQIKEDR